MASWRAFLDRVAGHGAWATPDDALLTGRELRFAAGVLPTAGLALISDRQSLSGLAIHHDKRLSLCRILRI